MRKQSCVLSGELEQAYRKNKRPVGHEQATTDPGILPLACLLVVTLGGIQADFHRFGLHSKAGMSDPRTEFHGLAVSMGNANRTASSSGADIRAVKYRLARLPSVASVLKLGAITAGASILVMTLTFPSHRSQVSMSIPKTRFSRCIHVIMARCRSSGVFSSPLLAATLACPLPFPRLPRAI